MARILIVEDELAVANALRQGLEDELFVVDVRRDGEEGLWAALDPAYDLIVLDRLLPRLGGVEICRRVRREGNRVPILMLTALDGVGDIVTGLDAGADDYVVKPFHFEELLARVRAQLRSRSGGAEHVVAVDGLRVDLQRHRAWVDGAELELTAQERRLVEYLARHEGEILSKTRLTEALWGFDAEPESNVLEVVVSSLRRKLGARGRTLIRTYRGTGYALERAGT